MTKRVRLEVAAPGIVNAPGQQNYYTETEVDDEDAEEMERVGHEVVGGRKSSPETLLEGAHKATVVRDSDEPNSDRREADRSTAVGVEGTKKVSTKSTDLEEPKKAEKEKAERKEAQRGSQTAETASRKASEKR